MLHSIAAQQSPHKLTNNHIQQGKGVGWRKGGSGGRCSKLFMLLQRLSAAAVSTATATGGSRPGAKWGRGRQGKQEEQECRGRLLISDEQHFCDKA
jgi:hypothetical protein